MVSGRNGILVLAGSIMLMLVLGSVHAFSIFLGSIEEEFGTTRSNASLTYSLALAVLTIHVLYGDRVFRRVSPGQLILGVCAISTIGILISGYSDNLYMVWIGYGVMFGAANGLGYSFTLQYAAQANPEIKGIAMGVVTASYGAGAAVAPLPFDMLLGSYGFRGGMAGLAIALVAIGPIVAFLFMRSGHRLLTEMEARPDHGRFGHFIVTRLWFTYGTAVAAGLMVIGHATGIAHSSGLSGDWIFIAPIVIAVGNIVGSCFGGYIVDQWGARRLLLTTGTFSALSLTVMWVTLSPLSALAGLAIIGFMYGATIAAVPVAIARLYGAVRGIRIYGLVFTAWGTAGLLAPWGAGLMFELNDDYTTALLLAATLGTASVISVCWFPRENEETPCGST
jgi:OFA family oxalate/formate antiporter-like MFS transporter